MACSHYAARQWCRTFLQLLKSDLGSRSSTPVLFGRGTEGQSRRSKRLQMLISVQALRALAAWAVVCHHFMQIFFDFHPSGPVGRFFTEKGAVGVDIFFVISGLVI